MITLLLLEDSDIVLDFLRTMLTEGYRVLEARRGDEAIQICENRAGNIDLLVADQYVPGGTGSQVALWIRQQYRNIPVLFVSGTPMEFWAEAQREAVGKLPAHSFGFVQKPFLPKVFLSEVDRLINQNQLIAVGA